MIAIGKAIQKLLLKRIKYYIETKT